MAYDELSDAEPAQHRTMIGRLKPQTVVDSLLTKWDMDYPSIPQNKHIQILFK